MRRCGLKLTWKVVACRKNHKQARILIKKLMQAGKAEEVAKGLDEFRGGPYDDGSQRFIDSITNLQRSLRGQTGVPKNIPTSG